MNSLFSTIRPHNQTGGVEFETENSHIKEIQVVKSSQVNLAAIKAILVLSFLSLFPCSNVYATELLYNIDGYYSVVFPYRPQLTGELGQGADKYRSYNYTDNENIIVYTATYQVGKRIIQKKFISDSLHAFIKGSSISVGGSVVSISNVSIDRHMGAKYIIRYKANGMIVIKYGVVVYSTGRLLSWTIQEFPSFSKINGETIFNKYVKKITIK